jgi:uncharacterized protein (TIGR02001 family)
MSLKRNAVCLAVATGAVFALVGAVAAEEVAPSISTKLDLSYVTEYVWRGLELNPDGAVQPSLTFEHPSGVSLNLWGSVDTTDVFGNKWDLTEVDYTLNYAFKAKTGHVANTGVIYYTFPHTDFDSTTELYGSYCFGGDFTPTISVNYDVDEADGFYASLSGGYNCAFPNKKAPTLGMTAKLSYGSSSYNDFYYYVDKSAFTDLTLGVALPFAVTEKVTVTPSINYSTIVDGDLKDSVKAAGLDGDNFWAGVTVSVPL